MVFAIMQPFASRLYLSAEHWAKRGFITLCLQLSSFQVGHLFCPVLVLTIIDQLHYKILSKLIQAWHLLAGLDIRWIYLCGNSCYIYFIYNFKSLNKLKGSLVFFVQKWRRIFKSFILDKELFLINSQPSAANSTPASSKLNSGQQQTQPPAAENIEMSSPKIQAVKK